MEQYLFLGTVITLALLYAYYNGANDCANTIATIIETQALTPIVAVLLAAIANAAGLWLAYMLGSAVAKTIGSGIVLSQYVTKTTVLSGLAGATVWAGIATWRGWPVSITHSLIGGVLGAGLASAGTEAIATDTFLKKVVLGVTLAPTVGFIAAYLLRITFEAILSLIQMLFQIQILQATINRLFRKIQVFIGFWLSSGHGMNDGQNGVGILALGAVAGGLSENIEISLWMVIVVGIAIALGTIFHGWETIQKARDVSKKLEPIDGCAAQVANAAVLTSASLLGMPISTTHAAIGSIAGASGAQGIEQINWTVTRHIVMAWFMTVPVTGLIGAGLSTLSSFLL